MQESQLRQQGAPAQQQTFGQARADQVRPTTPPPAFGAGLKLDAVVVTGVGARLADAVSPAGACYRIPLRTLGVPGVVAAADTIRLLNEMIPVRSDPSWYHAQAIRSVRDTSLMWRSVDSTTVELRSRNPSDSLAVRFSTTENGLPLPDVRREPGLYAVMAVKVGCP
jgi:hypothetical protein